MNVNRVEALSVMITSAELSAKASSLFIYGRASSDLRARSGRKEIETAFFQAGIVAEDDEELTSILEKRYPKAV
jgi:hypothetical protein